MSSSKPFYTLHSPYLWNDYKKFPFKKILKIYPRISIHFSNTENCQEKYRFFVHSYLLSLKVKPMNYRIYLKTHVGLSQVRPGNMHTIIPPWLLTLRGAGCSPERQLQEPRASLTRLPSARGPAPGTELHKWTTAPKSETRSSPFRLLAAQGKSPLP